MTTYAEKCAGKKANYRVYYRRNGRVRFDAIWAQTPEEAKATFLAFAREVGWKVEWIGFRAQ